MPEKGRRKIPREVSRQREDEAWKLRQQCWTMQRIADHLKVSRHAVFYMLERVEKRLWDETKDNWIHKKVEQSTQLEYLIEQALIGWQRSLNDAETYKETEVPGEGGGTKTERTLKGQSGNAAHLANVRAMLSDIRDIYGLNAPPKAAVPEPDTTSPPDDAPKDGETKEAIKP